MSTKKRKISLKAPIFKKSKKFQLFFKNLLTNKESCDIIIKQATDGAPPSRNGEIGRRTGLKIPRD